MLTKKRFQEILDEIKNPWQSLDWDIEPMDMIRDLAEEVVRLKEKLQKIQKSKTGSKK